MVVSYHTYGMAMTPTTQYLSMKVVLSIFYIIPTKLHEGIPQLLMQCQDGMFSKEVVQIGRLMEQANTIVVSHSNNSVTPTTSHNNHWPCSWNTWSIKHIVVLVSLNTIVDANNTKSTFQQHVVVQTINYVHSSVCHNSHLVVFLFRKRHTYT